jgi:hypothetical protein
VWIDSLHDATLRSITFDWRGATVRIELSRGTIVVDGVTSLAAPRANAWGPSASILEGELAVASDATTLTLHVQSGDNIVVSGTTARFEPAP